MDEEQKRARDVLDDLLDCAGGLSGKEIDFIEGMNRKRKLFWSEKQIEWLDIIYARVC